LGKDWDREQEFVLAEPPGARAIRWRTGGFPRMMDLSPLTGVFPGQPEGRPYVFDDDPRHPDWEMNRSVQRKFSIGATLVFVAVLLLNLVGGPPNNVWAEKPDAETVVASK
jgi:hypothetical protein